MTPEDTQLPPHSIEAEQGLIGCILLDPEHALTYLDGKDIPSLLFDDRHRTLFHTLREMFDKQKPIDIITLQHALLDADQMHVVGGLAYLTELMNSTPSAANLEFYLPILQDKAVRRRLIQRCHRLITQARTEEETQHLLENIAELSQESAAAHQHDSLYTMGELESDYSEHCKKLDQVGLSLDKWLPGFHRIRKVIPGEMIVFLGATGIGKTAILSNLALAAAPMTTLFYQLELPKELLFERILALRIKMPCAKVESGYQSGGKQVNDFWHTAFPGLVLCTAPKLTVREIANRIERAKIKTGSRPQLVLVDYLGLVQGRGQSRYDRFSNIAEDLRLMAKDTNTIVAVTCQIGRKTAEEGHEVYLTDAKESGSIENSASMVIGAWRDPQDTTLIHLKVLKSTKGGGGTSIDCNYNFDTLAITERGPAH